MKPQRFGRYELLEQMGRGGMATILLARLVGPSDFQKHLVIKRIHDHLTTDDETINRFMDEARLAARIHHPNVVQLFEFDDVNGTYYIAMEYVHGENLADLYNYVRKDSSGGYHWGHAARVVAEAAAGLHAAHELVGGDGESLRIVHRDVSPQNIMISYDGHVKVADFGIAQAVGRHHNTVDGTVMGKVAYMSPEQCRGEDLDRRTDVFALGIVLYEMVCLRRLFRAPSDQETMRRVLHCDFTPPRQARPDLPEGLEQILVKALAARREDRYQTAAELQYAIEGLLAAERAMITASSLSALMAVVFQKEKLERDRRIQKIYSQTFMEPPKPRPRPRPEARNGRSPDIWTEAGATTSRDTAPPATADPERRERTMRGFGTPSDKPIVTEDRWEDEAPTVVDRNQGELLDQVVAEVGDNDPSKPLIWPPDARPSTDRTEPVGPGPARRVKNLGPTVELGADQAARVVAAGAAADLAALEPRGAVQVAHSPGTSGATSTPASPDLWPADRHSGEIDALGAAGTGSTSGRSAKPRHPSSDSLMMKVVKRSTSKMLVLGIGLAVVLGVIIGLTLTYLGNRGREGKKRSGSSRSATERNLVTLRFKVSPPGAKLLIDGVELEAPHAGGVRVKQVPWQETPLLVRATADGYRTEERTVMPEKDQSLEIRLERQTINTSRLSPMGARRSQHSKPHRKRPMRRRGSRDPGPGGPEEIELSPFDREIPSPRPRPRPMSTDLKDPFGMRAMRFGEGTLRPDF